mmetsp:Transcript_4166/g.7059  ORF Transcript_4166/g.7059 Transcript_4166/m.7059 type:complete len:131 (-) Transcript_4166:434-826(-)
MLSAGMSPTICTDLMVLNDKMTKVGYVKHEYISPVVQCDALAVEGQQSGQLQMPCVIYLSQDKRYTFFVLRSSITSGNMRKFGEALGQFILENKFSKVLVLSSTISPVKRDRESNREIPEVYAYVNNFAY